MTTEAILQRLEEMADRHAYNAEVLGKQGKYQSALTRCQYANAISAAAADIRRAMEAEAAAAAALTIATPPAP